jgi:omega-6 fatty acid desaturase (delta-12 desaturase)
LGAPSLDIGLSWPQYQRVQRGVAGFNYWLAEHLRRLREHPGDDFLSQLMQASQDGARLNETELQGIAGLVLAAQATGQSAAWLVTAGFVVPFLCWNALIGFVVYVHHTHPEVDWYDDKASWAAAHPFVSTTVHLTFRWRIGTLLHNIMEHTAHHVDMSVPLYRLREAQLLLEQRLRGRIVIQAFTWRWYIRTARRCKLYDFANRRWIDFRGVPTEPLPLTA